jgi:hypothetical protein
VKALRKFGLKRPLGEINEEKRSNKPGTIIFIYKEEDEKEE